MSRRIALSVIAACAALSITPAFADNDCFDQTTCPPAEETLAREQRMLEERAAELKAEEARAAQASAQQAAEERATKERAAREQEAQVQAAREQEQAAKAQAAETRRIMEEAARAQEQAQAAPAVAAAPDNRESEVIARNKLAEEQAKREIAEQERSIRESAANKQAEQERQAFTAYEEQLRREKQQAEAQQRMPHVIEPPAPMIASTPILKPAGEKKPVVQPVPVVEAPQAPKETKPPVVAAPRAKEPAILSNATGIVPPVSTVPPKHIARPAEPVYQEPPRPAQTVKRVAETPRAQPVPVVEPVAVAQPVPAPQVVGTVSDAPRAPVRARYAAPIISSAVAAYPSAPQPPVQIVKGGKAAAVVVVRDGTYEDGMTPVAANVRPDPAVKFCQTGVRPDGSYVYCNQGSYHPYGANGYRPLGTYQTYRTSPGYITAQPGPRIISLVTD